MPLYSIGPTYPDRRVEHRCELAVVEVDKDSLHDEVDLGKDRKQGVPNGIQDHNSLGGTPGEHDIAMKGYAHTQCAVFCVAFVSFAITRTRNRTFRWLWLHDHGCLHLYFDSRRIYDLSPPDQIASTLVFNRPKN